MGPLRAVQRPHYTGGRRKIYLSHPHLSAIKGILESVYWKPTFIWVPDAIRVMNPIETESKGIRPILYQHDKKKANDLSIYTYLVHVSYQVKAHFEWNPQRPDLTNDRNENKHYWIAKRMLERGGRRDIFLGTRECQGYVEPCRFHEGPGAYDNTPTVSFGLMVHGITYADEDSSGQMCVRLWQPVMENGCDFVCSAGRMPGDSPPLQAVCESVCAGKEYAGVRCAVSGGGTGWGGLSDVIRPMKKI